MRKVSVLLFVMVTFVLASLLRPGSVAAELNGCGPQAIIHCGAMDSQDFIKKLKRNAKGDLPAIYAHYGLTPALYDDFAAHARPGVLLAKDNSIRVNGQIVGYSTQNLGRLKDADFTERIMINGQKYWGGPFDTTYHVDRQSVMTYFDKSGNLSLAVVNGTAAPQRIQTVGATATCTGLSPQTIDGRPNARDFTTQASFSNGARIIGVEYNFGDGTPRQTTGKLDQAFRHVFTKDSDVRASLLVQMPGGVVVTRTSKDCVQHITYTQPKPKPAAPKSVTPKPAPAPAVAGAATTAPICSQLTATLTDEATRTYQFTAQAQLPSGTALATTDYNFGDGVSSNGVQPNGTQAIISHSYAKAGAYTVTATMHFAGANAVTADCQTIVTAVDQVQYCKTGIPVGDPKCSEAPQLVNTGPGEIALGLFGGVALAAGGAHYWFRRRLGL